MSFQISYKLLLKNNKEEVHLKKTEQYKNNPIRKSAKDMHKHFTEEDIHMEYKDMKRCATSLAIREMQIKTTMKCHDIPIRMAKIIKTDNNKFC